MDAPPAPEAMPAGPPAPPMPVPGKRSIVALFALASFLMLAGLIVFQARALFDQPSSSPGYQDYLRLMRLMAFGGAVLLDLAAGLGVLFGMYVAASRPDLPDGVRRSFVLGPLLFAGLWLLAYFSTFRTNYSIFP